MVFENLHAEGMEGGYGHPLDGVAAGHLLHPFTHLARRLVGKGHRQNLFRTVSLLHQVGNTAGNDPGFARAGSGEQQQGAAAVGHGLTLLWIKLVQIKHGDLPAE